MALSRLFPAVLLGAMAALVTIRPAAQAPGGQAGGLSSLSDADLKAVTIRFERIGCYGNCPVYTLTIHGDGRMEYEGKEHVKEKGKREGRMDAAAIRALLAEFDRAKFLSLAEDYSGKKCCGFCTDMPGAITELSAPGAVSHRVNHYYGCRCAPKELYDLESAIDKAANVEQWTGDVSKQGPFGTTCSGG